MNRVKWSLALVSAIGMVLVGINSARAQTTTPGAPGVPTLGQHASDNVNGGALAARSPGNMVSAGVGRALAAADFAKGGIEITETTRPISPRAVFLVDAIEIIFDQLNSALLLFENVLRLRAGLPPLVPQVTPPTTTGSTTGG